VVPDLAHVERFSRDLDALIAPDVRVGIAVSGGPDSLALLLLAAAARPGRIEAATVDHRLRLEARDEAKGVGSICRQLGIPHEILSAEWPEKPRSAIQERARHERYRLLAAWAKGHALDAIVTGHHADDQAETLMMRLARGAGVRGLAAMRPAAKVPGSDIPLLRPLLAWRRSELAAICVGGGLEPASDPGNAEERFERVRVRRALAGSDWLDAQSLASTAGYLGEADAALQWAMNQEWSRAVRNGGGEIVYRPSDAPAEIRRRIVQAAVERLGAEGRPEELRGRELDRVLAALTAGRQSTIRGVLCSGGADWRFRKAPRRKS